MDACVRHLRGDGSSKDTHEGPCPVALVYDDLECTGGRDVMQQLVQSYLTAMAQGACTASSMVLLQLDGSIHLPKGGAVRVLDGWTDPAGWLREAGVLQQQDTITITGPDALASILQQLTSHNAPVGKSAGVCVVVDNLSQLLHHHPALMVMAFMEQLRNHPHISCIIAALHKDVVDSGAVTALQRLSSCVVTVQPVSELQQEVLRQLTQHTAHGCITNAFKSRKAGRLRVETCYYSLTAAGIVLFPAPSDLAHLMNPEALVALSVRSRSIPTAGAAPAAGGAVGPQGPAVQTGADVPSKAATADAGAASKGAPNPLEAAGGMRLTLTEEERRAKQAVVLPFEHKGGGSAYQTGDWRDYLPVAAGGRGAAFNHSSQLTGTDHQPPVGDEREGEGKGLGRILYVRDSDDEGGLHDSDEDPDDDLDI